MRKIKFSKKEINHAFNHPSQKNWEGSDPRLDFPYGIFTGENWNDARINLLRQTLKRLFLNYDNSSTTVDSDDGEYKLFKFYEEDTTHIFITYTYWDEDKKIDDNIWFVKWHKSRGKTDKINYNGKPVRLDELKELIYALNEVKIK